MEGRFFAAILFVTTAIIDAHPIYETERKTLWAPLLSPQAAITTWKVDPIHSAA